MFKVLNATCKKIKVHNNAHQIQKNISAVNVLLIFYIKLTVEADYSYVQTITTKVILSTSASNVKHTTVVAWYSTMYYTLTVVTVSLWLFYEVLPHSSFSHPQHTVLGSDRQRQSQKTVSGIGLEFLLSRSRGHFRMLHNIYMYSLYLLTSDYIKKVDVIIHLG